MNRFPHLKGSGDFPGIGRELYEQIPGAFDYGEWGEGAKLTVTSVPWGVYAPGVSADRPGFETEKQRDDWFARHLAKTTSEAHYLETRVRYQINDYIEVDFTFDYASRYNYLIVEYPDAPVTYGDSGIRKWYYHITEIKYDSPSCTTLMLVPDWWVTVAPLMSVNHMILERGHAPVAATSVSDYLSAPLDNSELLLTPDVDFGGRSIVATHADTVFNDGDVYAVICMRGVPIDGDFSDYKMPFSNSTFNNGVPSGWNFCLLAADLPGFLTAWQGAAAQSMQALEVLYFVGEKLLAKGQAFERWGYTLYNGAQGGKHTASVELSPEKFGFDASVSKLAKLYTYPYSFIEVADERGNVTELRVENLVEGKVQVESALNGAFPWLTVSAHVTGYGGKRSAISFSTAEAQDFGAGGFWYDTLKSWGVPCYKINQSAAQANDYHTHYSREQSENSAAVALANAQRSANTGNANTLASNATANANALSSNATANANALASNATARTNVTNNADNMGTNNAVTIAMNNAIVATSIDQGYKGVALANTKLRTDTQYDVGNCNASFDADMAQLAVASANNDAQAVAGVISGAVSMAASVAKADVGGGLDAMAGIIDTGASWATTSANIAVSQSNNIEVYNQSITSAYGKQDSAIDYGANANGVNNDALQANNTTKNDAASTICQNNKNLMNANADNTKATADANANRVKANADSTANATKATADGNAARTLETSLANAQASYDNALAAITASVAEASMQAPASYGVSQNGEFSNTRPMMISVNVVTESKSAIKQAATQFLRYGYALNQTWDFTGWNLMKHFTFWKVSDVWATGVNAVPEEGQDAFRRMLYDGITLWSDPDEIGKVSVYDNIGD